MFKKLFGWLKKTPALRMPEVDESPAIEAVFGQARKAAAGEGAQPPGAPGRHVVIVTPGRLLMFQACPPPGSMPPAQTASIKQMLPPSPKRKVAAIAYTELGALQSNLPKTIPFFGILLGFAYVGHDVWVFEGHPSALAAGCRDADVLIVDGGLVPYLQDDWRVVAAGAMNSREIYVHDRATYSLRKAT